MDKIDKIRAILNILFLVGAVASVILYITSGDDKTVFFYVCSASLFVKVLEFIFRFLL